ncbi:MarR family winged helix-turn-helix transcriptional regulator [Allosphingosinicella indica]|uniref:DNA-binding transcriptional regulator, MarR family n=1 Tax=Allosphingosinicella indica TaxID=941907 RepID=A0A1X7FY91_9SPHN|nr:MarR family transcriptional regulator [Allosphingosinicella indica]SMF60937.1 DNA-binding transcriptional regulator, MarR family [Allosphingosinicella indica]
MTVGDALAGPTKRATTAAEGAFKKGDRWMDDYLPYQLYRVTNRLNVRLQGRLKAIGINLSQWRVLSVLRSYGTLSISGIVDYTLMEQPTVSRVVVQLEQDGMVTRRISADDSRMSDITLVAKGAEAFDAIRESAYRHEKMALEGLDAELLSSLRKTLQRIERNIDLYE